MSRRNRSRAAFSLFSFQDIITSITAIVILLVLILTLELLTRRHASAAADPAVSRVALAATIASLEDLVGRLASAVPSATPRPLAERTRSEVERDVRIVREQAALAEADAEEARATEGRARALAAAAVARLEDQRPVRDHVDAMRAEAARLDEQAKQLALDNEQEAERIARKREELVEQPSPGAELVFNAPADFSRQAWILEVAGEDFVAVKLGTPGSRELGVDVSVVGEWLAELEGDRDHVLVLVRPSGIDHVQAIRELLDTAGLSFGIDFIGEEQVVRDGTAERQAAGEAG